jgi:hypothetical protein
MRSEVVLVAASACALGLCAGAWLALALRRLHGRQRARGHNARGQRAELDAERLLEENGYRILARKLATTYRVEADGASHEVALVLDYLVEWRGEQLAAEVKSGSTAPRLQHRETRRQLLEYQLALGSSAVVLVDPARARVSRISFPVGPARAPSLQLMAAGAFVLLCAALAWFAR